jgi:hypothetical protein
MINSRGSIIQAVRMALYTTNDIFATRILKSSLQSEGASAFTFELAFSLFLKISGRLPQAVCL